MNPFLKQMRKCFYESFFPFVFEPSAHIETWGARGLCFPFLAVEKAFFLSRGCDLRLGGEYVGRTEIFARKADLECTRMRQSFVLQGLANNFSLHNGGVVD